MGRHLTLPRLMRGKASPARTVQTRVVIDRSRIRSVANMITLATPLGLLVARATNCQLAQGPRGLYFATGYAPAFPRAAAFTLGNVVILRDDRLLRRPHLLAHEERHSTQWACCLGLVGFPLLYGLACTWSIARTGDHFSRNTFERRAGLLAGGYREHPVRSMPKR